MPARFSWSLTCRSFARIRFAIVIRRTQNRPVLVFPHMCVKPRKSNVSGFPTPRSPAPGRHAARTRSAGSCRVQLQPELREPLAQIGQEPLGIVVMLEADDEVVGETHDDHITVRVATPPPVGPQVQHVVGSPRGISPRGSHGTERDSLPSFRSSHPLHRYARIHSQWANSSGSLSVTPRHQALNRFQVRSRLYFFRAQRIT